MRFRTPAAAEYLGGLSPRTLAKWRISGRGPRFIRLGNAVVYDQRDLDEFLAAGARRSTSDDGSTPREAA